MSHRVGSWISYGRFRHDHSLSSPRYCYYVSTSVARRNLAPLHSPSLPTSECSTRVGSWISYRKFQHDHSLSPRRYCNMYRPSSRVEVMLRCIGLASLPWKCPTRVGSWVSYGRFLHGHSPSFQRDTNKYGSYLLQGSVASDTKHTYDNVDLPHFNK